MLNRSHINKKNDAVGESLPLPLPQEMSDKLHQTIHMIERKAGKERYSFALTSCQHKAGTSSLTWSLAREYSKLSAKKIVVVEANTHTPVLASALGVSGKPGFSELVSGSATLDEVIQKPDGETFSVITAGNNNSSDRKIFNQTDIHNALRGIREQFDITIVDTAPLQIYPETESLATAVDGLILVLRAEQDKWEVAQLATRTVTDSGANLLGAIINKKPLYIPGWLYKRL